MNPRELAAMILQRGKALAPDRFPQPSREVVEAWAEVVRTRQWPEALWAEAVTVYAMELVGERMCTPRDILKAAKVVLSRWESDPVRGAELRVWRERRRDARDARLALGLHPNREVDWAGFRAIGGGGNT